MNRPGFADRNQIRDWADTKQAQSDFPRLVRRLILETTPDLVELGMSAGEGVAAGKWDGSVRSTSSTPWVPEGLSLWELSVSGTAKAKAEEDYGKRDSTPDGSPLDQCTYVQAILRVWTDRDEFAKRHSAEGKWKGVRALGLDDIHAWLESAPITWAWFSEVLGLNPYGMRSGEMWWATWSRQTKPAVTPEVLIAGRAEQEKELLDRLNRPNVSTIEGPARDEVRAFIAAIAVRHDSREHGSLLARLAYVDELTTWRFLLDSPQPLILVPGDPEFAREVPSESPHTVLVPVMGTGLADMALPALDAGEVAGALLTAGMTNKQKSEEAGRLARRSLTALRRNLAVNSALHQPRWAYTPVGRHVRASLLAGNWNDETEGDRSAVASLAGEDYDEFREKIVELAASSDPMLLSAGTRWHLVAPFDSWSLLASSLTHDDLKRFGSVVKAVFSEVDPSLDVPEDERWWKAPLQGKVRVSSSDLRLGLARSVALLSVHGASLSAPGFSNASDWADNLVRTLLRDANSDESGRTWVSLSDVLPLLVEAGPGAFVDEVIRSVVGSQPVIRHMFTDQSADVLFSPGSPHTELLWALECLAWSPDHFSDAVDVLARLDEIDPGGRLGNRPLASLSAIFCPWHPETSVSAERRLAVIDGLRKRHKAVSWKLLLSMLPEFHGVHLSTRSPQFRDWKNDHAPVTKNSYVDFILEVVSRCVEDASTNGEQWSEFLDHYSDLPPSGRTLAVDALAALIASDDLAMADRDLLWNAVRSLVAQHRQYPDAEWALIEDELSKLEDLIEPLTPDDPASRLAWLFQSQMPDLAGTRVGDDYYAYEALLAEKRAEAVGEIVAWGRLDAVRDLTRTVEERWGLGTALAASRPDFDDELYDDLGSEDAEHVELALGYFAKRFQQGGRDWLDSLLARRAEGTVEQRARLLLAARDLPADWEAAEAEGTDVSEYYWKHFVPYGLGSNFDGVGVAARQLMKYGRNAVAIDLLCMSMGRDPDDEAETAQMIAEGLEGLVRLSEDPELPRLSAHDFEQSFELLEHHRDVVGVDRVARLEWALLLTLGYEPRVPTLHQRMADSPEFFVEVMCAVFRSKEDARVTAVDESMREQQEARARNGYYLLSSWNVVPGFMDDDVDANRLHDWLDEARRRLGDCGRLDVGLVYVGHVLASSPPDLNGNWPPEVVRDLLEEVQSEKLESGLLTELLNRRGITSRGLEEGGAQELQLAARYRADAARWTDQWPRTAALLRHLAQSFESEARRHEDSAEFFRRGLE